MERYFNSQIPLTELLLLVVLLFTYPLTGSAESTAEFNLDSHGFTDLFTWGHLIGDNLHPSELDKDDSIWSTVHLHGISARPRAVYWCKTAIELTVHPDQYNTLALRLHNFASAYEVYWDGQIVARNGIVGTNPSTEKPGAVVKTVKLNKTQALSGRHILAIRLSNFHDNLHTRIVRATLAYAADLQSGIREQTNTNLIYVGIYSTAALFCLFLFFSAGREGTYLLLGLYCLVTLAANSAFNIIQHENIRMTVYPWLEWTVTYGEKYDMALLVLFFVSLFEFPKRSFHILAVVGLVVIDLLGVLPGSSVFSTHWIMLLYSAVLVTLSSVEKKTGSTSALTGVAILAFAVFSNRFRFFQDGVLSPKIVATISPGLFVTFMIMSVSAKVGRRDRRLKEMELKSRRLETEMLKKSIQPHFIMNTLLTIRSFFQRDPEKAEDQIDALSEEFRMINTFSGQREISLQDEIALCRNHLKLMSCRRDAQYTLDVEGETTDLRIPPMVFHTLIENGLTHSFQPRENGVFLLRVDKSRERLRYRLENGGSRLEAPDQTQKEGVGFGYVRARLAESYGANTTLSYGLRNKCWVVEIEIEL